MLNDSQRQFVATALMDSVCQESTIAVTTSFDFAEYQELSPA